MDTKITIPIKDGKIDYNKIESKPETLDDEQLLLIFTALEIHYKTQVAVRQKLNGTPQTVPPITEPGIGNKK